MRDLTKEELQEKLAKIKNFAEWHKYDTRLQGICEVSDHDRGWYNAICHVLNIIKQDLKGADNE